MPVLTDSTRMVSHAVVMTCGPTTDAFSMGPAAAASAGAGAPSDIGIGAGAPASPCEAQPAISRSADSAAMATPAAVDRRDMCTSCRM